MALKYREREEIVGKRFLCLQSHTNNSNKQNNKRNKLTDDSSQWQWKRGTVRAATHTDSSNTDLNILVEFDGVDWKKREWIRVYEQNAFQLFLIEYTLVWVNNKDSTIDKHILCPSLNFKTLVDKIDFKQNKLKPIEYLIDKRLEFVDYNVLKIFQDSDLENQKAYIESPEVKKALRKWTEFQDSQRILLTTPSVLVGYRVKVYRSEGTTQWYTAVIVSYNENTRELTLTDDTVLEEHNEDPSLVQMKLIGDGVVESILKGEDIGITPRRRACNQNQANSYARNRSGTTGATSNSGNNCPLSVTTTSTSISSQSTTNTSLNTNISNTNLINSSSNNITTLVTRKKSRRNSSDITTKESPNSSPANTLSDLKGLGRVITSESKTQNSVNINRNVFEAIQRKNIIKETKETTGNSGSDQQLLHSYKTKRSIHYKYKSEPKKLEPSPELDTDRSKSGNSSKNSESNVQKLSECVDNSGSSDTEIEDSLKSSNNQKRQNRSKRIRKKCSQSSDSDVDAYEEDNRPKVITDTTVANTCDNRHSIESNVNEVKGSETICFKIDINEKFEENNNKCYELKSRTQTSDSNSANVITSVDCVPQLSSDSGLSTQNTIQSNKESIDSIAIKGVQQKCVSTRVDLNDCNACQMVPTMCSVDEQLNNISTPYDKSETFPTRPHISTNDNNEENNKSSLSLHLNSGPNSCAKLNSDNNNNNNSNIKSESNKINKTIGESNDSKRSSSHSLAFDRLESITVYRDPNLADKQTIRHIDSVQHLRHGLMHSVNTTTASTMNCAPEFGRMTSSGLQTQTCQPSILPPSVSSMPSMAPQYKLKSQPIHSHSSHPPQTSHLMNTRSHGSLPHSNSVDPQIYHMMQTHPMVSGLSAQSLEMLWQQKNYSPLSSMAANGPWNMYNEQIRTQLLHNNDKQQQQQQQGFRIERDKRQEKEKHLKMERESDKYADKERVRQELIGKEKEENAKEAVEQHFEESLRLARQKKSGWSPISNLPLSKAQTNVSRQSHVLPQSQSQHSMSHLPQQHPSVKSNVSYGSHEYERHAKDAETERWMAYMQQHSSQQTHSSHSSRVNTVEAMARHKTMEQMGHQSRYSQSLMMSEPSNKGTHSLHSSTTTSPVMEASKPLMTTRAKTEPSFSLYGYQPNQNISYITPAQLKENNRHNRHPDMSSNVSMSPLMTAHNDLSKGTPPAAHGSLDRRESPKIDRSLTPNSRNSTPIGRPPSLSPKQKSPKMMAPDRISPLYHRSQTQGIKQYDYTLTNAPPAHQSTSSRSGTPILSSSPISLQIQSQIPVAHSSQTQEQPQNLVKSDSKSKLNVNEMTKTSLDIQRESPNASLHSKTSSNLSTYQSYSLIQQGLVPNPLYKASPTTQSTTGNTSMPSVITRPLSHSSTKTSSTSLSPHMSQKSHMFTKPGPGIVSGIPICRPNSIPYYDPTQRTNVMNPQKYPQTMSAIKSDSVNTYPEMTRMAKLPQHSTHSSYNPTQDRNVSVFHRLTPSPHSPRISSGSVPPSPYGPAPGMVTVNSSVAQSHVTPPAAHSGANAYNNLSVKRKSVEIITISSNENNSNNNNNNNSNDYTNKKQRLIESPVPTLPPNITYDNLNDNSSNNANNIPVQSTPLPSVEVICDVPTKTVNTTIPSKDSPSETDFLPKHQKAISVASRTSNVSNTSSPVNTTNEEKSKSLEVIPSPASSSSSISSFHPKLKKAWLQRHSEDKTGVGSSSGSGSGSNASFSSSSAVVKNISENSNSSADTNKDKDIKVKSFESSINGSIDRKNLKDDELSVEDETSSASETELSNSSKGSKRKTQTRGIRTRKRIHTQNKDNKKRKSNSESNKSDDCLKIGKENEEKKKREKTKTESDKESNDLRSTTTRRGRKPKAKNEDRDKTSKESSSSSLKKKVQKGKSDRTAIAELKKSGAPFLQGGSCVEVAPKLPKCRECRMTPTQRNRKPTIFCRFYDYRKLAFKSNVLTIAGFSQPQDATEDDLKLWLPNEEPPTDLDTETAKFVIAHVGDQFCDLVKQEKEAQLLHMGSTNKNITWKRVVQGVREMCDVCETTLFNIHWVCDKCGFVVCIDCYKARKVGSIKEELCPAKDRDGFQWLLCNNRQQHEPQRLEVTQIIAATALSSVGRMLHNLRTKWNISSNCSCISLKDINHKKSNGFTKQVLSVVKIDNKQMNGMNDTNSKNWKSINGTVAIIKPETDPSLTGYSSESGNSPLSFFVDVALTSEKLISKSPVIKEEINEQKVKKKSIKVEKESEPNSDDDDNKHSTLRELLMGPTSKSTKDKPNGSPLNETQSNKKGLSEMDSIESETKDENCLKIESQKELQHFTRRYFPLRKEAEPLPIVSRNLEETKKLFPQIPHNWFCDGKLLVLNDPKNSDNIHIFQQQWIRGQPVVVKDNHKNLNSHLWHPDSFSRDFGDIKNDLVNCLNGDILSKQPMRKFWDGFESLQIRMKDKNGDYMLLKLKDWPPDEEFSELLPTRYRDLMSSLPLPEYTNRNGVLNLAGRLPDCFVRPDLGPKMYSAYGSCLHADRGTTNLHLDISDAVNVMIFVGIPKESHKSEKDCLQEVLSAVDSGGCDEMTKKRVREKGVKMGALWHIYNARDADKIRDLLNKVAIERGETLEPHHDPIHDQSWYLGESLRNRLLKEYGVEGYAIAQCLGDAIFIPAGAPHQVRNLNSCIKVAGDFVSPENVSHCFHLTQEFRQLSDTHTNHEDKLQIKNIIYHAVKDALSVLRNQPNDSN